MNLIKLFFERHFLKVLAIIFTWILAKTFIIHWYGLEFQLSLLESVIQTFWIFLGFLMLGNIFSYYSPRRGHFWIVIAVPFVLAAFFSWFSFFLLVQLIKVNQEFQIFLSSTGVIKGVYFYLMFQFWAILLVFAAKLEDQRKIREMEDNSQKLAKEAEMYYLRQQLQPHFLFNSLNSINALIVTKPEEAREMVVNLAEFLRGTIKKDSNKWISLSEELEQLKLFLSIEKVRFGDRLKVSIQAEKDAESLTIPQLMVQPLLENAIKHSLYGLRGEVLIQLGIKKENKYLIIRLSNPFDPKAGQPKGSGFGLEAVKRRLYLIFGRNDLIQILKHDNNFIVILRIPQP
ncbi:sensor histidine kinase [Cecembia rubra]|uniref:Histidine kinase n=1 Tax=Cecembia rubra TaxID=1485585 RepID=A0A2P8E5Y5_9BACT|nr:histidine kinase [Cecembia rubra]PSL04896.1 histidine kinase [Cecembia rubra]